MEEKKEERVPPKVGYQLVNIGGGKLGVAVFTFPNGVEIKKCRIKGATGAPLLSADRAKVSDIYVYNRPDKHVMTATSFHKPLTKYHNSRVIEMSQTSSPKCPHPGGVLFFENLRDVVDWSTRVQ